MNLNVKNPNKQLRRCKAQSLKTNKKAHFLTPNIKKRNVNSADYEVENPL